MFVIIFLDIKILGEKTLLTLPVTSILIWIEIKNDKLLFKFLSFWGTKKKCENKALFHLPLYSKLVQQGLRPFFCWTPDLTNAISVSLKGNWGQNSPQLLRHNLNDFYGRKVLYKVSRWFDRCSRIYVSYKVLISLWMRYPRVICMFLLILWKKNLLHSFVVVLTISHELKTFRSSEWLNCVST